MIWEGEFDDTVFGIQFQQAAWAGGARAADEFRPAGFSRYATTLAMLPPEMNFLVHRPGAAEELGVVGGTRLTGLFQSPRRSAASRCPSGARAVPQADRG